MANFSPEGIIRIGTVPFDNSYRHTMTFANATAQSAYFQSCMETRLANGSYTYVRMNNSIRVPFNAEELYTHNYVMYQNRNYGQKWFYAFIVGVNYLNEGTTELVLELDVMQTWYFDYQLVEGFVEREHVDDDSIGAHLNPEPEMPFNIVCKSRQFDTDFRDCWAVVQTNAYPHYSGGTVPDGSDVKSGGWYQRQFNGSKYYAFAKENAVHGGTGTNNIFWFLESMNQAGAAESISNIFMFPKEMTPPVGPDSGIQENTTSTGRVNPLTITRPTSLDGGYVPRNNKLFTFPYCYCMIDDNNGNFKELRYELWNNVGGSYPYARETAVDPSASCYIIPMGYNGVTGYNMAEAFTFPMSPKCSWNYSSYQTWSAQNALSNALTIGTNAAMLAIPAARGAGAAAKALGVAGKSAKNMGQPLRSIANRNTMGAAKDEAVAAAKNPMALASAGFGGMGLANFAGEVSRQSKVPDTVKSAGQMNTLYAINNLGYSVSQMVIQREFAEIVDDFLDMYGYQVDRVKVPNRTGRPAWNYVKMQNSCHRGNVPADDMAMINAIYDAGITFWHTSDIGNYSRSNK